MLSTETERKAPFQAYSEQYLTGSWHEIALAQIFYAQYVASFVYGNNCVRCDKVAQKVYNYNANTSSVSFVGSQGVFHFLTCVDMHFYCLISN